MSCSFCSLRGHDVRACRDPMIGLIYERIKVIYVDMLNQYPITVESAFKSIVNRRFNLRELRAVCATHTNFPSSRTKAEVIYSLYLYYSSRIRPAPRHEEEEPWLENRRLPTQPDPIPNFARDLEEPSESEEEHDITWYIDTTPAPMSILRFNMMREPETPERLSYAQMRQITGGDQTRVRDFIGINLMSHFDAVSGNIPFAPQVKKYNINPVLVSDEVEEGEEECAICYENIKLMDLVKLNCDHKFCGGCITGSLKAHNNMRCGPSCALCRKQMVSFSVKNPEIYSLVSEHCNL